MSTRNAAILTFSVLVIVLLFVALRPHVVTVWRVYGADGAPVEASVSQLVCENDALSHNQRASDVNTYGKYACRSDVEFQWGW